MANLHLCIYTICLFVRVKVVCVLVSDKFIASLIYQSKTGMLNSHIIIYFCFSFCVINFEIGKNLVSCRNFKKKDVNKAF